MRDFREQIGAEIHNFLEHELALLVDLRILICRRRQLDQSLIDPTTIEGLKEQSNVVVKEVLIKVDNVGGQAHTTAPNGIDV